MRDYDNMPKLEWKDDKATLAKIKSQIMREEPVILLMPVGFNFDLDTEACACREESGLLIDCRANATLASLGVQNDIPALQEIGKIAEDAGQIVDIDSAAGRLVLHD